MRLVAVKFRDAGKRYHFNAQDFELDAGAPVIVETDRGRALGTIVVPPHESEDPPAKDVKNVIRPATEEDLALAETNRGREADALRFCQQRIEDRGLEMKLVRAEYLFDGSKIIFYFTADGRIDFRELVKDLAHYFHTRIEMRQIGVRDEAKLVGGIGVCGRELCCCTFLTEFSPVSVKMAKEQGLALNPNKISGQCGRLLCCLSYEFETYCKLRKGIPKTGKKIQFDGKNAEVIDTNILAQKLTLRFEDGERLTVSVDEYGQGATARSPEQGQSQQAQSDRPERQKQQRQGRRQKPDRPRQETSRKEETVSASPAQTQPQDESGKTGNKPKRRRRRRRKPKQNNSGDS